MPNSRDADEPQVLTFRTSDVDPRWQLDTWEDLIVRLHGDMQFKRDAAPGYQGRLRARQGAGMQFVEFDGAATASSRNASQASSDGVSRFEFMIPLAGECWVQHHGHRARMSPGRFMLVDLAEPHTMAYGEPISVALIACDRSVLEGRLPGVSSAAGAALSAESPVGAVLLSYARGMRDGLTGFEDHEFRCMLAHMLDLGTLLLDGQSDLRGQAAATQRALLHRLKQTLRRHLAQDTLTLAEVAQANGISARYMQKLFQSVGTSPRAYLLEARLLHARARLRSGHRKESVASVAYASGFASASHFSTRYKARFGYPPGEEVRFSQGWAARRGIGTAP